MLTSTFSTNNFISEYNVASPFLLLQDHSGNVKEKLQIILLIKLLGAESSVICGRRVIT